MDPYSISSSYAQWHFFVKAAFATALVSTGLDIYFVPGPFTVKGYFLISSLFLVFSSAKNGLVNRRYRKAIGGLEAEVHQLRNLPLAPDSEARGSPAGGPQAEGAFGQDG